MKAAGALLLAVLLAAAPALGAPPEAARRAAAAGDLAAARHALERWLAGHPDDDDSRFLLARVLAWQGHHGAALEQYDRLLRSEPANADFLLEKGRTLLWAGRPRAAADVLARARELAPDYAEVRRLEILALRRVDTPAAHRAADRLLAEARTRFPEEDWPPGPGDRPRWQLAAGARVSALDNGYDDWTEFGLRLDGLAAGDRFHGQIRQTRRYGRTDREVAVGGAFPIAPRLELVLDLRASPTHRVLCKWAAEGGLEARPGGGWVVSARVRRTEYDTSRDLRGAFTLERYAGAWHAAYTLTATRLAGGGTAVGQRARLDRSYGADGRSLVGLTWAVGEEVENIGPDNLLESHVWALILSGRHWVTARWGLWWSAGIHHQDDFYDRREAGLGLLVRF
ncbi:YaiO family outer membrane beta-barrel protein [Dissulfurirhabdus thermomarina]|uniref:YaiO family outer membrane beta-barrel protein n=1 Tax=Dissulfurirhabdus thermomarina TaxID=1765737 RepID=A0A6N9TK30_DISTH|nr:YaiO family outer membrane beta-barrel protein [Dissulfurirhabdus thermomarina]NDY41621.1 YaiO family outer membrane beta-barrel protein [Dissulfurirhabdus thermomarina]NMX23336.1 YaiO family outer membrane beta-barrel protein [Dissulfurirhabdus thermomarina]